YDVPDFVKDKAPDAKINEEGEGMELLSGADPFIMHADGRGWLYAPHGLRDGPLPAHFEPFESPIENPLYPKYKSNPAMVVFDRPDNPYNNEPRHGPPNPAYPYILTTYRITEHHTSGAMSRWNSWLSELQPELFVEISPQLAAEKGIENLDWVTLRTARTAIEGKALVTDRMQPMRIQGRLMHVIGIPYHWGPAGLVTGDIANDLLGVALDPNVRIHESKALTCALEKGRHGTDTAHGDNDRFRTEAAQGGAVGRTRSEGAEMLHDVPLAHS
ncbi:MAG TPA: formate dehydrogenase subunit alpha, partial [Ktedonobacterales bacterium]|nr:formate dehydrogenase subunit alpha [Ktedonobacterales bacterium]